MQTKLHTMAALEYQRRARAARHLAHASTYPILALTWYNPHDPAHVHQAATLLRSTYRAALALA